MSKRFLPVVLGLLIFTTWVKTLPAANLFVPNGSFESPATELAGPPMDSWQKAPPPFWFPGDPASWDQVMGQFLNTPPGMPNHIDNMDGDQAAYLFALPDVAVFQDYNTISGTESSPTHQFNALYQAGKSYALTAAILGGGGGMSNGATFEISFYYRDTASNLITVAATTITNSLELFPTNTHFLDFQVRTPIVRADDAWAGKHIGIRLASTVGFELQAGYWDVDHVRVTESVVPNGSFESPETDLAAPPMDSWQKSPPPVWFPGDLATWEQAAGQFLNTTNGAPNHIDNLDGEQAAYLFAVPELAIFQEPSTNTTFAVGKSYALTVAVLGGSGGMSNGTTLEISLYYRDPASNMVMVSATTITNSLELFPTNTHFLDFQTRTPVVQAGDAWAGQIIGIRIASTIGFDLQAGYWDVDHVRLAESVLPNSSFESPETDLAAPPIDAWQKSPPPVWFPGDPAIWAQGAGQFLNTSNGAPNHIDNMDGEQAAYLFAVPELALFQDSTNTTFAVGKSYALTVAVLGGGGGMSNGTTLEISLYYRDPSSNMVTVSATTITNSLELFPTNTHFLDFQTRTAIVRADDPWAGQPIGIRIASTIGFDLQAGYWDVDHVRLSSVAAPLLRDFGMTDNQFGFTLESAPGRFEILSSTDLAAPTWVSQGTATNFTGTISFTDENADMNGRFYQVRPSP